MEWINYLLKVSACTALFFAFYLLVLRKLTFFKFNRFYLLGALVLSFIIPVLQITLQKQVALANKPATFAVEAPTNTIKEVNKTRVKAKTITAKDSRLNISFLVLMVYGFGVAIILIFSGYKIGVLLLNCKQVYNLKNGLKIIDKSFGYTNCSFFNYVFIHKNQLNDNELNLVLAHEGVHAKQLHSVDKLFLLLCKAFLWFNPIIYLYDKALYQVHEYEADEATSKTYGHQAYAESLLRLAVEKNAMPLVNNFEKSPVKDRIKMLFILKSNKKKRYFYLLALPLGLFLVWGFTVKTIPVYVIAHKNFHFVDAQVSNDFKKIGTGVVGKDSKLSPTYKNNVLVKQENADHSKINETAEVTPEIISYQTARGDLKSKIIEYKGVKMKLVDLLLEADEASWNEAAHTLVAKKATILKPDRSFVKGDSLMYDLKNNTFTIINSLANTADKSSANTPEVYYRAKDSVKLSRDKNIIRLYGNALCIVGADTIFGNQITYIKNKQILKILKAKILVKSSPHQIVADSLLYHIFTGKVQVLGGN